MSTTIIHIHLDFFTSSTGFIASALYLTGSCGDRLHAGYWGLSSSRVPELSSALLKPPGSSAELGLRVFREGQWGLW